ncbi:hypothetical protein GHK62_10160 [Sinorhizobium terangae]|uniref:Uncharacterized protein n=1 Tax=Sinorhizobium terangae TaxID=110322 RepID=A0A6N7LB74_SINTE|nr:hypothetical protein [Sinorhizobium terangae]
MCGGGLLHDSLNRNRFKDKIMQQIKVLQRPWRVRLDARRCRGNSRKSVPRFSVRNCAVKELEHFPVSLRRENALRRGKGILTSER